MGEAALELIMSQLSKTEHRPDLDVVVVVAIELSYMATPKVMGVGQAMPSNTKIFFQKALESGMREVKSGHRRHAAKISQHQEGSPQGPGYRAALRQELDVKGSPVATKQTPVAWESAVCGLYP